MPLLRMRLLRLLPGLLMCCRIVTVKSTVLQHSRQLSCVPPIAGRQVALLLEMLLLVLLLLLS
jgi:hypothetical protein